MNFVKRIINAMKAFKSLYVNIDPDSFGHAEPDLILELPAKITKPENLYIGKNVAIRGFFTFISHTGKLIIKDNVGISQKFSVITGNHTVKPALDKWQVDCNHSELGDIEQDTIVENDVWIGFNVTLMPGVTIGRGSIIGAGAVVTKSIPPYTIAVGNPCRPIRMKFTKEEIIERELILYPKDERMTIEEIDQLFHI